MKEIKFNVDGTYYMATCARIHHVKLYFFADVNYCSSWHDGIDTHEKLSKPSMQEACYSIMISPLYGDYAGKMFIFDNVKEYASWLVTEESRHESH